MATLQVGTLECGCSLGHPRPRLIVLTGGPGAGKTAVLELVQKSLCRHLAIMPEAAGIVFGGGFPRHDTEAGRQAAQRAIFHVQRELEDLVLAERRVAVALCDRGTVDGLAYWPGPRETYFAGLGTTLADEVARYAAVIHLRTPAGTGGYDHRNPLRTESASEAAVIDAAIAEVWSMHPRRFFVDSTPEFLDKAIHTVDLVRAELPARCQGHVHL